MKESDKIGTLAAILTGQFIMTMFYASRNINCSTDVGLTLFMFLGFIILVEWGIGLWIITIKLKKGDNENETRL